MKISEKMGKPGEMVLCIRTKGLVNGDYYWTVGKEYMVSWREGWRYVLIDNNGNLRKVYYDRFISTTEINYNRNNVINNILN